MNSPKWDWSHALSHRQKLPPQLPLTYLRPLWSLTRRHLWHSSYFLYLPAQTSPIQTDHHPAWRYPLTVAPALLQPPRIVFGCCPGDRWRVDAYDKNNNPLLIRATKSQQLVEACHTPLECASYLGEEKSREIYMTGPSVWRWEGRCAAFECMYTTCAAGYWVRQNSPAPARSWTHSVACDTEVMWVGSHESRSCCCQWLDMSCGWRECFSHTV